MELDDPGFHHSVLADFRERLAQDDRADRLLDLALARLKEAGLVRERTAQRTDSTHVLAAVRNPTRLELVTEAVRAAPAEVARTAEHLLVGLVDEEWGRRYGRPVRLGKNPTRPKTRILAAGDDACRLLELLHQHEPGYRPGPQAEALRQIVVQNYYRDAAGRLRWRTADDGGLPPSSSAIVSPHDTTARYVRHGCRCRPGFGAGAVSRRRTVTGRYWMRSGISWTTASSGGPCPRTSRPGTGYAFFRRWRDTAWSGSSTTGCADRSAKRWAVTRQRRPV